MGVTLTEAVIRSLESQLKTHRKPLDMAKIRELQARVAALPVLDTRTADEILGYDEFGLPS